MSYFIALLIAGLSGCAALSHELLWTRRLIDLLGASTTSTTLVFECFFLGLALGAACSTGLARRVQKPWHAVAKIELGIALLSIPALTLPSWTGWIWPWLGPQTLVSGTGTAVKLAISVLVMIPPTFLMGMTLPFMARAILTGDNKLGRQGVWLYSANTFGGVAGLLWTTTVALPWFGVSGSIGLAVVMNLLIAGLCLCMEKRTSKPTTRTAPDHEGRSTSSSKSDRVSTAMFLIAFASGAGVLGVEVLSMHLFMQVAPSAIHATAAVLAAIILMLAVSAFLTPYLAKKGNQARELLTPVMMVTGLATASTPLIFMWMTSGMTTIKPSTTLLGFNLKMTGYVLVSLGPGILMAGLVLPLVFSWYGSEGGDPHGRRWGWLLAVNGLGGVLGAEAAQRLILPAVGMHAGLGVFGLGYAALAGLMVLIIEGPRGLRGPVWRPVGIMLMIFVIGVVWLIRLPLIHPAPTEKIQFKTLAISAGSEGVVAVTESDELGRGIVMFNQYVLGSTAGMADEQRQAHLPILLHARPRDVAFIGLATGITAGAALLHDDIETVTAIELSRLVAEACKRHFKEFTNDIAADPRANIVVEDGRTYIASCVDRFDVVMGDLFLPWRPGVGRLFSIEHFQSVRMSLRAGGLYCQMLPMYQFSRDQMQVVVDTFTTVFPKAHLFRLGFDSGMPVLAIVGLKDDTQQIDWPGLPERCRAVREAAKITDPVIRQHEGIAMLYLGPATADGQTPEQLNTLGNAWVELTAGKEFVTGRWHASDYFMNHSRWREFEGQCLRQHLRSPNDPERTRWSRLGNQISRWNDIRSTPGPSAETLRRKIQTALPEFFWTDRQIDKNKWPLWADLLKYRGPRVTSPG